MMPKKEDPICIFTLNVKFVQKKQFIVDFQGPGCFVLREFCGR